MLLNEHHYQHLMDGLKLLLAREAFPDDHRGKEIMEAYYEMSRLKGALRRKLQQLEKAHLSTHNPPAR